MVAVTKRRWRSAGATGADGYRDAELEASQPRRGASPSSSSVIVFPTGGARMRQKERVPAASDDTWTVLR